MIHLIFLLSLLYTGRALTISRVGMVVDDYSTPSLLFGPKTFNMTGRILVASTSGICVHIDKRDPNTMPPGGFKGMILIMRGWVGCSLEEIARMVQAVNGSGLIIIDEDEIVGPSRYLWDGSDRSDITIPSVLIGSAEAQGLINITERYSHTFTPIFATMINGDTTKYLDVLDGKTLVASDYTNVVLFILMIIFAVKRLLNIIKHEESSYDRWFMLYRIDTVCLLSMEIIVSAVSILSLSVMAVRPDVAISTSFRVKIFFEYMPLSLNLILNLLSVFYLISMINYRLGGNTPNPDQQPIQSYIRPYKRVWYTLCLMTPFAIDMVDSYFFTTYVSGRKLTIIYLYVTWVLYVISSLLLYHVCGIILGIYRKKKVALDCIRYIEWSSKTGLLIGIVTGLILAPFSPSFFANIFLTRTLGYLRVIQAFLRLAGVSTVKKIGAIVSVQQMGSLHLANHTVFPRIRPE